MLLQKVSVARFPLLATCFLALLCFASATLLYPNRTALFEAFNPNYTSDYQTYGHELLKLYEKVAALENSSNADIDLTCPLQMLSEAKYLISSSANMTLLKEILINLKQLLKQPVEDWPLDEQLDDGGWGVCYLQWWLRLDDTYDHIADLADAGKVPPKPVHFLDSVNNATALLEYFKSRIVSDLPRHGMDYIYEVNMASAALYRLISRDQPSNYNWYLPPHSVSCIGRRLVRIVSFHAPEQELYVESHTYQLLLPFHHPICSCFR